MSLLTTTFDIPDWLEKGLKTTEYIRYGGEVRNQKGELVAMLRDAAPNAVKTLPDLTPLGTIIGGINLGVSILNLGVSVVGFAIVINRLGKIEQRLKQLQDALTQIERKIDNLQDGVYRIERNQGIAFCANFHAALELANNACTMLSPENRLASALQAVNRFLETQYIYTAYTETALEIGSQAVEECLSLLSLAYIAEVRCYLELGEIPIALSRLQQGSFKLRPLYRRYLESLLTSNPAAYLHPNLKNEIDLERLVKVYQWLDPIHTENSVFQELREGYFKIAQSPDRWVHSLHPVVSDYIKDKGIPKAYTYLPQVMEKIESLIETYRRFEAYQTEVKAIAQLGISFHDWLQLAPQEPQPEGSNLMYIIPAEPLAL